MYFHKIVSFYEGKNLSIGMRKKDDGCQDLVVKSINGLKKL